MSASLVGSEMCIRDRLRPPMRPSPLPWLRPPAALATAGPSGGTSGPSPTTCSPWARARTGRGT
eukprot:1980164-Alexandrium_andersonii.AAC.1